MYDVLIERTFSSAHFLRQYRGQDEPLHGHNYRVQVKFTGKELVKPEEYLVDFVEVNGILDEIVAKIDYKNINEVPPFDKINSSAENIARWIHQEFAKRLPAVPPSCVTVWETDRGAASYRPD
jgi:6-pyruvoyltetrahydropterin/6-carboxytetrahydropterin synthase